MSVTRSRALSSALALLSFVAVTAAHHDASAQSAFAESAAAPPAAPADDVRLNVTAGSALSYGNSRTFGLNVALNLTIRQSMELFVVEGSFLYGISQSPLTCGAVQANPIAFPMATQTFCGMTGAPGAMAVGARAPGFLDWRENASNVNWRLRYDHFFDLDNAFFLAHRGRIDYFAGLDLRIGFQAGYSRTLLRETDHTLAVDLGVDATVDIYSPSVVGQNQALVAMGTALPVLSGTNGRLVPSLRLALAYVNHINAVLTYDTTFETLWDVANPEHFRFEWVNHIRSAIDTWLQISLDVTFRLDSLPPGQARAWRELQASQTTTMFDMVTTLNLVGNFDLDGERAIAAEEAAECPAPTPCPACPTCGDAHAPAAAATPAAAPAPTPAP